MVLLRLCTELYTVFHTIMLCLPFCLFTQENRKAISTALEQNKEETAQIVLQKDASLEELHQTRAAQEGQLAQAQATVQELQTCLARETER